MKNIIIKYLMMSVGLVVSLFFSRIFIILFRFIFSNKYLLSIYSFLCTTCGADVFYVCIFGCVSIKLMATYCTLSCD